MRPPKAAAAPARNVAQHIASLDGIRACAVMLVFVAHAGLKGRVPGEFGVTVFFFLSGYLITTLLRVEHERTGSISFRAFYLRRVLRIFPPFYLVLGAATLLWLVHALPAPYPSFSWGGVLSQVFFLTNYYIVLHGWWDGHAQGTWIFWSLAVEEHFYLLFPLVYLLLLRFVPSRHRQALVLAGLCGLVLAWRLVLVFAFDAGKDRTYVATDTRIDSILFGCILAILANPVLDRVRIGDNALRFVWVPLAAVGLLLSFAVRNPHFQETTAYTIQGICLFPLFIAAVRLADWGPFQLLNWRAISFVGVLSYSIYLLHPTVLWTVNPLPVPGIVQALVALAVTLAIAYGIYVVVEKPAARLRRRLSRVLVPQRPPAPAPPPEAVAVASR
ncbi:MAG TPA: acyltransferase [Candidatus Dormibacteraeota bacterium]